MKYKLNLEVEVGSSKLSDSDNDLVTVVLTDPDEPISFTRKYYIGKLKQTFNPTLVEKEAISGSTFDVMEAYIHYKQTGERTVDIDSGPDVLNQEIRNGAVNRMR